MKPVLVMTDKSGAMGATVASLPHMGGHGGHDGRPWATLYPPPGPVHIFAILPPRSFPLFGMLAHTLFRDMR